MGPNCGIIAEDLIGWLDKIVYLISPNIRINLKVAKKGKDAIIQKKYINKNGLYDYAKLLAKKPSIDPLYFTESKKLIEHSRDTDIDRNIKLSFVFTFDSTNTEFVSDSFCNYVNTIDNGTHVDAVKQAIMQYLTKQTRDNLSERESKNIDILFNDVTQGLVLIVNIETDLNPQYTGQTKEKVSAPELFKPIRDMTYKTLIDYFKQSPKELKKLTDRVKTNAKARIESTKVRNSVIKGETTNFQEHLLSNFEPANKRGKNDYRELNE